jgi:hypothetical protein
MSQGLRDTARSNRLLGALETASRKRIDPHLEPIKLKPSWRRDDRFICDRIFAVSNTEQIAVPLDARLAA